MDKLVRCFGYPDILRTFTFSWDYMMKGLIIDKVRSTCFGVYWMGRSMHLACFCTSTTRDGVHIRSPNLPHIFCC